MKLYISLLLFIANGFITPSAHADNFSAQTDSPTSTHSLELQNYVKTIANYQPETAALKKRLLKTIAYYKKVHILKTINKPNYTVDCIPFAEQSALISTPALAETMLEAVRKTTKNNWHSLKTMGKNFDFNPASQCPRGSVAILRPSKTILTSEQANKKVAPGTGTVNDWSTDFRKGGYSYELGEDDSGNTISIKTEANQAYFKGPQNQSVVNTVDHSLNQFWFANNTYDQGGPTYTTEFGIIASAYFTTPASTSIFVFASVDNYGSNSCYNVECSNFVQFPNTPVLGSPTNTSVDYLFQVTHTTLSSYSSSPANYLTLTTHNSSGNNAANSSSVLLGYYSDSLYPSVPQYFSAGAEVYASSPNNGTKMYGNYMTPYVGYNGPLKIQFSTENHNSFPYSETNGPAPYGLIWRLGQAKQLSPTHKSKIWSLLPLGEGARRRMRV